MDSKDNLRVEDIEMAVGQPGMQPAGQMSMGRLGPQGGQQPLHQQVQMVHGVEQVMRTQQQQPMMMQQQPQMQQQYQVRTMTMEGPQAPKDEDLCFYEGCANRAIHQCQVKINFCSTYGCGKMMCEDHTGKKCVKTRRKRFCCLDYQVQQFACVDDIDEAHNATLCGIFCNLCVFVVLILAVLGYFVAKK